MPDPADQDARRTGTRGSTDQTGAAADPAPGRQSASTHVGTPPGTIETPGPDGAISGVAGGKGTDARSPAGTAETEGSPADADVAHDRYWRASFAGRDYTDAERGYGHYRPAYHLGWESRHTFDADDFETVEDDLRKEWDSRQREAGMAWHEARPAVRDAWLRAGRVSDTGPGNPLA